MVVGVTLAVKLLTLFKRIWRMQWSVPPQLVLHCTFSVLIPTVFRLVVKLC